MNTLGTALMTALTAIFSVIIGKLWERRKQAASAMKIEAEAEGSELQNVEKAIAIWRKIAEDMGKKAEILNAQVNALIEENKALRIQIGHFEAMLKKHTTIK